MPTLTAPILSPERMGLPSKFREFSPQQIRAINLIHTCTKKHLVLPVPTGGGKSAMVIGAALSSEGRSLILTGTRQLQDQYKRDFETVSFDIRGKSNYLCELPGMSQSDRTRYGGKEGVVTCDFAPCSDGWKCWMREGEDSEEQCTYYSAVARARQAKVVVTNYAYYLAQECYGQGLGAFERVYLDEAHNAGEEICRFLACDLYLPKLRYLGLRDTPAHGSGADKWLYWADKAQSTIQSKLKTTPKGKGKKELTDLKSQLESLNNYGKDDWVCTYQGDKVRIEPVWPYEYLNLLTGPIPKVVLVSATLTRKTVELLGVGKGEFDFREFPSTFPAERRPLYYYGVAAGNARGSDEERAKRMAQIVRVADRFIDKRYGRRGIIHSVSYSRAEEIYEASSQKSRLVLHRRNNTGKAGGTLAGAIEKYMGSVDKVLCTPAGTEGVDLPHDGCRFQIIAKVPFPDRRDPVTAARTAHDKDYVNYLVGQILTQTYGRSMRTVDDWGETIILDRDFGWMRDKVHDYVPEHVWEAYQYCESVPEPIEF